MALKGERFDGHAFLEQAAQSGAAGLILKAGRAAGQTGSAAVIAVDDTRLALGRLAQAYRRQFRLPVVAVAGSNGKTTTKDLIASVLRLAMPVAASEASFNNDVRVPLTLFKIEKGHRGSGWAAVTALALALVKMREPYLAPALAGVAVAALWLTEFRWGRLAAMLWPATYGVTLALVMLETHPFFAKWWLGLFIGRPRPQDTLIAPWVSEVAAGALLAVVAGCLLARAGDGLRRPRVLAALAAAVAVGALSVEAPGIATGLMIVLLGYAAANRVLVGIGLAALLFYLSAYYYMLMETLLYKSAVLAATGLILLAARWLMLRFVLPEAGDEPA